MNDQDELERILRAHYAMAADDRLPAGQLAAVHGRIGGARQRPSWRFGLTDLIPSRRPASFPASLLATLALVLAAFLLGVMVSGGGPRLPLSVAVPTPVPPSPGSAEPARLVFLRGGNIYVAAADGTRATQIVTGDSAHSLDSARLQWAPSGRRFAVVTNDRLTIYADDGRLLRTFQVTWSGSLQFAWAPDGHELAILSQHGPLEIVSVDGAPTRRLALPAAFGFAFDLPNIAWSPDGRTIAFTGCGGCLPKGSTSALWVEHADGTGLTDLGNGPFAYDPVWAPDGSLLFGQGSIESIPVGLARIQPDGSDYRFLVAKNQWLSAIEPSPDGSRVLLFGNPNSVMTVDADGSDPVLAKGIAAGGNLRWSVDGHRILTVTATDGLIEFDPDGNQRASLLTGVDTFDLGGSR